MNPEFETTDKIDPRLIWEHQAHVFTPWSTYNFHKLGDPIGIELELIETEANVSGFSLDQLAKDFGRNANIFIEIQLAASDHDHLGKLIPYASGYDADVVLWVSTEIREEHRQALDLLNQRTDYNIDFIFERMRELQQHQSRKSDEN